MKGTVVRESSAKGHKTSSKSQRVGGLRADKVNIFLLLQVILFSENILCPSSATNSSTDKSNSSKGNSQEEVAANETFSHATGRNIHDTILSRFNSGDKPKRHSTNQVAIEHLDSCKDELAVVDTKDKTKQHRKTLSIVDRRVNHKNLAEVIPHNTTLSDSNNDCGKVVICKNHFSCFTCNISALLAHSNTHVSCLECRGIIHTITSHTSNLSLSLKGLDNSNLVFRRSTGKDIIGHDSFFHFIIIHGVEFWASDGTRML
mmetsp:Transcript_5295/g.9928  ORF Transcript_5295/g.9928 Transcript_5295/m.9928 type:complete len:260 (-) Transcript_5295:899-1678(-)